MGISYNLNDNVGMLIVLRKDGTCSVHRDNEWIAREEAGRVLIAMGESLAEGHGMCLIDVDEIEGEG